MLRVPPHAIDATVVPVTASARWLEIRHRRDVVPVMHLKV